MALDTNQKKFRVKKKKKSYIFEEKRQTFKDLSEKFQKGEQVIYTKNNKLAEILAVHFDDFPNIYYTIKILNNKDKHIEKQTPENNLEKVNK